MILGVSEKFNEMGWCLDEEKSAGVPYGLSHFGSNSEKSKKKVKFGQKLKKVRKNYREFGPQVIKLPHARAVNSRGVTLRPHFSGVVAAWRKISK